LLEPWLAAHARRVATLGRERFDRLVRRFELEIDEVDVEALRRTPPR
jgi:hypothetical protein